MTTGEALATVLKMAKDRGGFRTPTFRPDEQEAIREVESLLHVFDSQLEEDYDESERY